MATRDQSAGQAAPLRESLSIITQVRRDHRDNEIRYRRSLQTDRVVASVSMCWVEYDKTLYKSGDEVGK